MKKLLVLMFVLFCTLDARENPFFPSQGEKDILITSNQEIKIEPLKRAAIELPTDARVLQKVTITFKNLDGSLSTKSIDLKNSVDWHLPIFISQKYSINESAKSPVKKSQQYKKIASLKGVSFYEGDKSLKVVTKDKIIRNFLLVKPHRIVLDFKAQSSIKSFKKRHKNSIFTELRVGSHKGYYRAVIELDGYYQYSMKKTSNGYLIKLK